jgi:hypothetical protein
MPIPFIIGGIALAAGAFGAKKGLDAKNNYAHAKSIVEEAVGDFESTKEVLERQRSRTTKGLKRLGEVRLKSEGNILRRFVDVVKPINQVTHKAITIGGSKVNLSAPEIQAMEVSSYKAADLLKDGIGAISSGVLTGIGAGGLATTFGVASTGTAISGLAGVAATNATLAWLGGGSLAAGGMGMAGGMAVLGGAIAGPVIAIVGFSAAKKSEKALTEAFAQESEIREAIEQLENGVSILGAITERGEELAAVIEAVSQRFQGVLQQAEMMISSKQATLNSLQADADQKRAEYDQKGAIARVFGKIRGKSSDFQFPNPLDLNNFSDQEKNLYTVLVSYGYALNALLRVKVLDDDGSVTYESESAISEARNLIGSA